MLIMSRTVWLTPDVVNVGWHGCGLFARTRRGRGSGVVSTSTLGRALRPKFEREFMPTRLAFAAVLLLWIAFAVTLVADPEELAELWERIQALWLPIRAVMWLFFLPWILGLWVWLADWLLLLRLAVVSCLAVGTVGLFYPCNSAL